MKKLALIASLIVHIALFHIYIEKYKPPLKEKHPLTPEQLAYLGHIQAQERMIKAKLEYLKRLRLSEIQGNGTGNSLLSSSMQSGTGSSEGFFNRNNSLHNNSFAAFNLMLEEIKKVNKFIFKNENIKKEKPKKIHKIKISGQAVITKSFKKQGRGTKHKRKKLECPIFFGGLGFQYDPRNHEVLKTFPNSPASEFLKQGDVITGIEENNTLYTSLKHIIGTPFTSITVIYYRKGKLHKYTVERNKICYQEKQAFQS